MTDENAFKRLHFWLNGRPMIGEFELQGLACLSNRDQPCRIARNQSLNIVFQAPSPAEYPDKKKSRPSENREAAGSQKPLCSLQTAISS
jgi:hypothetical protein